MIGVWLVLAGDIGLHNTLPFPTIGWLRACGGCLPRISSPNCNIWISAFFVLQESQLTDVSKHTAFLEIAAPALHLVW